MKKVIYFYLLILSVLINCTGPISKSANYKEIANQHQIIAVLPPKVIIEIKDPKNAKEIKENEKLVSEKLQQILVNFLNKKKSEGAIFVSTQSTAETNKILADNGIQSLANYSYQDLAKLLNVDAVISSRISLAKPMSNAAAIATSILTYYGTGSRMSSVDLSLTDKASGKTFWNYNWQSEGIFTDSEKLTNTLMKGAAQQFPYKVKK